MKKRGQKGKEWNGPHNTHKSCGPGPGHMPASWQRGWLGEFGPIAPSFTLLLPMSGYQTQSAISWAEVLGLMGLFLGHLKPAYMILATSQAGDAVSPVLVACTGLGQPKNGGIHVLCHLPNVLGAYPWQLHVQLAQIRPSRPRCRDAGT